MYTLNNAGALTNHFRAVKDLEEMNDLAQIAGRTVVRMVRARSSRNDHDNVPEMLRGAIFLKL
jgi:hypothetical protein